MLQRILLTLALLIPVTVSAADGFVAGKDYEIISANDTITAPAGKITVTEFFSYGCPWCYRVEPTMNKWVLEQGKRIQFSRVPVVFNKDWAYYAKAYYMVSLLEQENKFQPLLFKTIQTKQGTLNSNEAMIQFFVKNGVNRETAESAFTNSTTIDMHLNQGAALMAHFRVNGVPAVVINGKYKTDLKMAQGEQRFFKILDHLMKLSETKTSN